MAEADGGLQIVIDRHQSLRWKKVVKALMVHSTKSCQTPHNIAISVRSDIKMLLTGDKLHAHFCANASRSLAKRRASARGISCSTNGASRKTTIHRLIEQEQTLLVPGVHDALSAKVLAHTGHVSAFVSGYAVSCAIHMQRFFTLASCVRLAAELLFDEIYLHRVKCTATIHVNVKICSANGSCTAFNAFCHVCAGISNFAR